MSSPPMINMMRPKTDSRSKIQWDCELRQLLCCMARFFVLQPLDFESIFSEIYRNQIIPSELVGQVAVTYIDVTYELLRSEWLSMRRNDSAVWHHVHTQTGFRRDGEWKRMIHLIQSTADKLQIHIVQRDSEPIEPRYGRRLDGEYFESILIAASSPTSHHSAVVPFTPVSILSDPLPIQETIEANPEDSSNIEDDPMNGDFPHQPLVLSHDKKCIWCEWEQTETPCPSILGDTAPVNFKEPATGLTYRELATELTYWGPATELTYRNSHISESPDLPTSPLRHIGSPHRPSRSSQELPPLLFRWWNKNSHGVNTRTYFQAGAFEAAHSTAELSKLESMDRQDFLLAFKNHVNRAPVPSPFISTFQSPLAPIHRALRYQDGAAVSVIDPSKLATEVFKASPLVEITNTALMNWKGFGEYEVWKEIPPSAIVCTFSISDLIQVAENNLVIYEFLQIHLIHSARYCTRFLYNRLAKALKSHRKKDTALKRLMELFEVPQDYRELMCRCFKKAWLAGTPGQVYEEPEDGPRSDLSENDKSVHPINMRVYPLPFTPPNRIRRGSSELSYIPPKNNVDSDSDSDSGEEKKDSQVFQGSQSPEARCPRKDTPSSGYSVRDDSDSDAYPEFDRKRIKFTSKIPLSRPIPLNFAGREDPQKTPEVSDTDTNNEPSDGEDYRL